MKQLPFILWISLILIPSLVSSQVQDSTINFRDNALNIFVDCDYSCDMNFLKDNITMINYIRTVQDADIYILVTSQNTGSGGQEITLTIEGQKDYDGQKNEIIYNTEATSTSDERRNIMVKNLKAAILPFVAQTPLFENIEIKYNEPISDNTTEEVQDKWNNWVYSMSLNGWLNGQSNYKSLNMYGNVSARKITEKWKISLSVNGDLNRDKFVVDFDEDNNPIYFVSETSGYGLYTYVIKAINDHWSIGGSNDITTSTYSNIKLANDLSFALEYNLYPYKEYTKRQLRFIYQPGYRFNSYADTTIYNKTYQHLPQHRISTAYETQSKWGSIDASLSFNQFLHDPSLYSVRLYTGFNIRVVKGLQVNLSGNLGWIRNQIALPKGDASEQDILTQQRELATNYSYWANFGVSYSFGSLYNNVVFPRFGGSL